MHPRACLPAGACATAGTTGPMRHQGSGGRWRLRTAAASFVVAWAFVPLRADAGIDGTATPVDSAVCQISSLTILTTIPVSTSVTDMLSGTSGTPYSLSGQGSCTTPNGPASLSISGSGATVGSPTCTDFVGSGAATITVGTSGYNGNLYIAGPTASSDWALNMIPVGPSTAGTAAGDMSISTASLDACMQGGTTTLDYTGEVVVAPL